MARRISRRLLMAAGVILLIAVVVPFINVNRFKTRLSTTMSAALNRPVSMGDISLRVLPQPGFYVENFVMGDDPAFSSEPMLRAESVTAALRLTSLWRGKIEIAKLSFAYPSLNLVRNADGRWNMEGLLMRASQVQTTPTARKTPQAASRFPYIEANDGRINVKIGNEKLAHSLVEADFALWLESENQWNVRLEARPTRTDAHLTDTGVIKVEGSFERAESLMKTPLHLRANIEKAQLGQLSALLQGKDRGWRGNLDGTVEFEGTVADFRADSTWELTRFHRYDVSSNRQFNLRPRCQIAYGNSAAPEHSRVTCETKIEDGSAVLERVGSAQGITWKVLAERIPASTVADFAVQTKVNLPADLNADGAINALFMRGKDGAWSGEGRVKGLVLSSKQLDQEHKFGDVVLTAVAGEVPTKKRSQLSPARESTAGFHLQPFTWNLDGAKPVTVSGSLHGKQGELFIRGEASLPKVAAAARFFGLQVPEVPIAGTATQDLMVHINGEGFQPPSLTGKITVRNSTLQFDGINAPIEVASATVIIVPDGFQVSGVSANIKDTKTTFSGSFVVPYPCKIECVTKFDLHASEIDVDDANRVLNPKFKKSNWLAIPGRVFGGRENDAKRLLKLRAEGTIAAKRLTIRNVSADNVTARASIASGLIRFSDLRADLFGGKHFGGWTLDFSGNTPSYSGGGTLQKASAAALLRTNAGGKADLRYQLWLAGAEAGDLRESAKGQADFTWSSGSLPRAGSPFTFSLWTGKLEIDKAAVRVAQGEIKSGPDTYLSSGQVSFDRTAAVKLEGSRVIEISGKLEKPEIKVSAGQAAATESASNNKNAAVPKAVPPSR